MTPSRSRRRLRQGRILRSLPFRVVVFLALALLPIGLLAIWQTRDLAEEMKQRTQDSIVALTALASAEQRRVFERAFGAGEALGSVILLIRDDTEECNAFLQDFRSQADYFSFIGYLPPSRNMTCSSSGRSMDFSAEPDTYNLIGQPRPALVPINNPRVSAEPVISVMQPIYEDGAFEGYITLSIPAPELNNSDTLLSSPDEMAIYTFNEAGQVLTVSADGDLDKGPLPQRPLEEFITNQRYTFEAVGRDGEMHVYGFTPLVGSTAFALSAWPEDHVIATSVRRTISSSVFPLAMWIASLLVAYFAVHRLVVGQVRGLSRQMRRFAADRTLPRQRDRASTSAEFDELESTFLGMAYDLTEDEAKMENALREKNVLLKEVHHRVKNNLQMISSIMNMQIRTADSDRTRRILQRLQDRILGLATVHRHLYQSEDLADTDAGALLREVTEHQLLAVSDDPDLIVETRFDPIHMFPDQVLPLSLMVGELATNAMKYARAPAGERRRIELTLDALPNRQARVVCRNSVAPDRTGEELELAGTGLGLKLIRAFAVQLGSRPEIVERDGFYEVSVTFTLLDFQPQPLDY